MRKLGSVLIDLSKQAGLVTLMLLSTYYGFSAFGLVLYNFIDPPLTGVQLQRQIEALFDEGSYTRRYQPVPLSEIADPLEHAVVAAEDGRFFDHTGVDWQAVRKAVEDNIERGRTWRGGSTITQQLVKNLFMTTHSSYLRKALEVPLTYQAEVLLSKERILELYLNVIEWGPGVYGAEAAAVHHFNRHATNLTRRQAAGLAACIPSPRTRTPPGMPRYTNIILRRMRQMGH